MSLPSFPNIDPPIQRENAVNQILSSIALEELGLSNILNAEGEKLQYILGTLPGLSGPAAAVEDVLSANESVRDLLKTAVQNQLFLKSKMQEALEASPMRGPAGPPALPDQAEPPVPLAPLVTPVPPEPPVLPGPQVPPALSDPQVPPAPPARQVRQTPPDQIWPARTVQPAPLVQLAPPDPLSSTLPMPLTTARPRSL